MADSVAHHLRRVIGLGHFTRSLPSERELAAWYGVSRPILRQALGRLRDSGLLCSHDHGRRRTAHLLREPAGRASRA